MFAKGICGLTSHEQVAFVAGLEYTCVQLTNLVIRLITAICPGQPHELSNLEVGHCFVQNAYGTRSVAQTRVRSPEYVLQ